MSSKTYKIKTEADRAELLRDIKAVALGFNVRATRRTRTHDQNDLLWGLLSAFAKQADIDGKQYDAEAWKCIFMNALGHSSDMLPTLDGKRFFSEGYRSSRMTVKQMNDLLDFIYAEGAERGVDFGKFANPQPAAA